MDLKKKKNKYRWSVTKLNQVDEVSYLNYLLKMYVLYVPNTINKKNEFMDLGRAADF